jgi:hypothetical protein
MNIIEFMRIIIKLLGFALFIGAPSRINVVFNGGETGVTLKCIDGQSVDEYKFNDIIALSNGIVGVCHGGSFFPLNVVVYTGMEKVCHDGDGVNDDDDNDYINNTPLTPYFVMYITLEAAQSADNTQVGVGCVFTVHQHKEENQFYFQYYLTSKLAGRTVPANIHETLEVSKGAVVDLRTDAAQLIERREQIRREEIEREKRRKEEYTETLAQKPPTRTQRKPMRTQQKSRWNSFKTLIISGCAIIIAYVIYFAGQPG